MQNYRKAKFMAALCICCVFLIGAAHTVFGAGTLTVALSSSTVKTGDTVTVTVYAAGADNSEVTADMNITYDSSKLEYVSSSASNASGGGGTVKASASELDIKFKAIGSGDAYVKAEGATLTAAGAHITVSGTSATTSESEDDAETDTAKSGDNSLSSVTISPGTLSPAFKGSVTEYTAEVGSSVNEITVNPVTSNSKATVVSVSGNKDLKEGKNIIEILVKAENGNEATYRITVTKGTAVQASSENPVSDNETQGETPEEGDDTLNPPVSGDPSAVVIDGVNYTISSTISDDVIPEGFSRADFEYKGAPYQGIMFDSGYLGMYYLVNEAGEGKFFIYDANRDRFYPYVRLQNGEHFIILMVVPNGVIPPDNYEETTLTIGEVSNISAYQYAGDEDKEIVKVEDENGEITSNGTSDFYIFYGMDATGISCWYQYDIKQGTYQRFNEEAVSSGNTKEEYESLSKSYKELDERQKATKAKDRRWIAILIFVSVVLLIVIVNLVMKIRELKLDDDEDEEEVKPARTIKHAKSSKVSKPSKPVKKARPQRETYKKIEEPKEEETYFYDDDLFDEFEDDPGILSRKNRKKEMAAKKAEVPKIEPVVEDEDDDLEFLDLNDL